MPLHLDIRVLSQDLRIECVQLEVVSQRNATRVVSLIVSRHLLLTLISVWPLESGPVNLQVTNV